METFLALPEEKQIRILEAGFSCFGKMGYKKASVQDIAKAAGISKGMIFHYFGSKKDMYLYLLEISTNEIMDAFKNGYDNSLNDLFDRLLMLTNCKIICLKKHPSLLAFFASIYAETDPEVVTETQAVIQNGLEFRNTALLLDEDIFKFKKPEYAELSMKLVMSYGETYTKNAAFLDLDGLNALQAEFENCVSMLRQNLYKEEYLKNEI